MASDAVLDRTRWTDPEFLDHLRSQGDTLADEAVTRLVEQGELASVNKIFKHMTGNGDPLPDDVAEPFRRFLAETAELPAWVDLERVERGERIYMRHALTISVVLLAKSLPEGYSAPNLTRILHMSGDLEHHPFQRLMGVLQMIVNICSGGFDERERALVTAQKLRLLHAGVRHVADRMLPDYRQQFGAPVNHEDMIATVMGFSYLVIEGLHRIEVDLTPEEAEDLYYLWRVFAQLMGIHPVGRPDDPSFFPEDLAAAKAFYDLYGERHFTGPEENPEGVTLTRNNLRMMQALIPRWMRWLGLGIVPSIYMEDLLTQEARARVGVEPVAGHRLLKRFLLWLPRMLQKIEDDLPGHVADHFGQILFQSMIVRSRGGQVTFLIPDSLEDLHKLA